MGHRKKKVKKNEFEKAKEDATRQWLVKASQVPFVRFYGRAQKVDDSKICFDQVAFCMHYGSLYENLDWGKEEHVWIRKKDFIETENLTTQELIKNLNSFGEEKAKSDVEDYFKFFNRYCCSEDINKILTPLGINHVDMYNWVENIHINAIKEGDYVSFDADIVPYQRNDETKDLGLKNIRFIRRTNKDEYNIPTDDELIEQEIRNLVCETCVWRDHCDPAKTCVRDQDEIQSTIDYLKDFDHGQFTPYTVMAAYEKTGALISQLISEDVERKGLRKVLKKHPPQIKKMVMESILNPPKIVFSYPERVFEDCLNPSRPRRFIEKEVKIDEVVEPYATTIANGIIKEINEDFIKLEEIEYIDEGPYQIDNDELVDEFVWIKDQNLQEKVTIGDRIGFRMNIYAHYKNNTVTRFELRNAKEFSLFLIKDDKTVDLSTMEEYKEEEEADEVLSWKIVKNFHNPLTEINVVPKEVFADVEFNSEQQSAFQLFGPVVDFDYSRIVIQEPMLFSDKGFDEKDFLTVFDYDALEFCISDKVFNCLHFIIGKIFAINCALNRDSVEFANVKSYEDNGCKVLRIEIDHINQIIFNSDKMILDAVRAIGVPFFSPPSL